jgi:ABC-type branched-subunit amino acid transport system ATPase component
LNQVTVLNPGRTLAAGTPDEICVHKGVVNACFGG